MILSGQDMDKSTNPFEAGLGWLVNLDNGEFIGKSALLNIKRQGISRKLIGLGYVSIELATIGTDIEIIIRNKPATAQIVSKQFYKRRA